MLTSLHISRIIIKAWLSVEISVIYVSTRGHWDYTPLRHFCTAEGCTVVLKSGTISMPTGKQVDNDFIPGLKTKTVFGGFFLIFL